MKNVVRGYDLKVFSLFFLPLVFITSCTSEEVTEVPSEKLPAVYSSLELELLDLVNEYRISEGYRDLIRLDEISEQALHHCEHMARVNEVCHHNFGERFRALAEKVGAKAMGENIGYGYKTSEAFFRAWLNSEDHRKIVEGQHTHFGISARDADGKTYVTLIFIRK